jgi:hypothetical protein
MIRKYINYLKDNPEGFWFKRKLYGWGWTPAKWQGWVVILAFVAVILWNGVSFGLITKKSDPTDSMLFWFFAKIIIAVAALIFICYKKGEKPRWQWGLPKDK